MIDRGGFTHQPSMISQLESVPLSDTDNTPTVVLTTDDLDKSEDKGKAVLVTKDFDRLVQVVFLLGQILTTTLCNHLVQK